MTSSPALREYPDKAEASRPNANAAFIAIAAMAILASVCILLLTSNRADLWPTVAMIGSLCGFGTVMSFFVTRTRF